MATVETEGALLKPSLGIVPTPPSPEPTKELNIKDVLEKPPETRGKYYVKFSFMITYILLLTTATLTFIEAMRTTIPHVRHIMNLETCISIVAGYFYSVFLGQIETAEKEGREMSSLWGDITKTRYIDWSITTPIMLLTLCVVLSINSKTQIHLTTLLSIFALNYTMLGIGFLGEFNILSPLTATIGGFIPFLFMFYIIYSTFLVPKYDLTNNVMFGIYLIVWALYGVVYRLDDYSKNISVNILDCIAKCLIGNFLYIYYAKLVVI